MKIPLDLSRDLPELEATSRTSSAHVLEFSSDGRLQTHKENVKSCADVLVGFHSMERSPWTWKFDWFLSFSGGLGSSIYLSIDLFF